jgi:hypothetical protein
LVWAPLELEQSLSLELEQSLELELGPRGLEQGLELERRGGGGPGVSAASRPVPVPVAVHSRFFSVLSSASEEMISSMTIRPFTGPVLPKFVEWKLPPPLQIPEDAEEPAPKAFSDVVRAAMRAVQEPEPKEPVLEPVQEPLEPLEPVQEPLEPVQESLEPAVGSKFSPGDAWAVGMAVGVVAAVLGAVAIAVYVRRVRRI